MNAETVTFFSDIAGVSASIVARRFRGYTTTPDLVQEAWVWALEHPKKLAEIVAEEEEANRTRRLRNQLVSHLGKVARAIKAQACGYEPDDEFFYTLPALRDLLPGCYGHVDWTSFAVNDLEIRPAGDPAEGGNRVAELSDVNVALGRLSKEDQRLLFLRYGVGDSEADIAGGLSIEQGAAHMRLERALKRLQDELGGPPPRRDQPEYTGSRRVMTNAHAQAITGEHR